MVVKAGYPGVVTNQAPSQNPTPNPALNPPYPCVGHRPLNASTSPIIGPVAVGAQVTAIQINDLRAAIRQEIARWQQHPHYTTVTANAYFGNLSAVINGGTVTYPTPSIDNQDNSMVVVGGPGSPGTTIPQSNPNPYPPGGIYGNSADVVPTLPDNPVPGVGTKITIAHYNMLLTSYNQLRYDCICNTDCSCNAVCACHGDCGCNYSDMRLKREIQYC